MPRKIKPNILYLDFETSGLDCARHVPVQAAWIVEKDGEVVQERVFDVCPDGNDDFCLAALDCNDFTLERLRAGKGMALVVETLKQDCLPFSHIRVCGHNIQFDIGFLMAACRKLRDNLTLYLDIKRALDTLSLARYLDYKGKLRLGEYHLETLCHHFGVPIKAHDALEDVRATRLVFHHLEAMLK